MLAWLGGLSGCGDRSGLLVPDDLASGSTLSAASETSSSVSTGAASSSAASLPSEAGSSPPSEPQDASVSLDALPPVSVPPAAPPPSACADGGSTLIYLISEGYVLLSYDPPSGALTPIGQVNCPSASQPFSMAVDQTGIAYVLYEDGELFRVSTANANCEPTGFVSQQQGFPAEFGMGFAQNAQGTGETLYVAGDAMTDADSVLASIDTTSLVLTVIGAFEPPLVKPELTGTGAGGLFAFAERYAADGGDEGTSVIAQIDPATAQVVRASPLPTVDQGIAWAFAFWGGDFYTFTAPPPNNSPSVVQRYSPSDGTVTTVGDVPAAVGLIVGAGVSTCAPQTLPQGVTFPR